MKIIAISSLQMDILSSEVTSLKQIILQANAISHRITANRRWLHLHPGVGFDCRETLAFVKKELENMGYATAECGKCGLTAELIGNDPGKTLLLRADMDGLPIQEETTFSSQNGNMHACGHDLHTAMLLGAAFLLKKHQADIRGKIRFLFQSAEEIYQGSLDAIQNGAIENADAAVMIHVLPGTDLPTGTVVIPSGGNSTAAADSFEISLKGKSCHGSTPEKGIDPLPAAAEILLALNQLPAKEFSTADNAVLTIGKFQGGTANNVIADNAHLSGSIRTFQKSTQVKMKARIQQISNGIAAANRAECEIRFPSGCPAVNNDPKLCKLFSEYISQLIGKEKRIIANEPGTGSEDFGFISERVPSVMLILPAGEQKKGFNYPLHHPKVTFDESVLPLGAAVFTQLSLKFLAGSLPPKP